MIITRAEDSDLDIMVQMIRSTFIDTYSVHNTPENMDIYLSKNLSYDKIKSEFKSENCHFFIGRIDNDIFGYLKLNTSTAQSEEFDPNALEIERIYVLKEHHKKGLGAKLIRFCVDLGKERKSSFIWLGVWDKNENAIGFYKRMEFEIFDTHSFHLGTDLQKDYLMKLNLD